MKALQRCNLRFSKGQIKLTCKDYSFILRCFLQMHPHRLAAQTFLWVVYWTMSHTAVQQPHWYKGIRRCYENMRGEKTTSFETDGFKEASQAESNYILLWSAWKKKSENMSVTADYNGQAVSVFHVWLPSIRRHRRLIGPGIVWLMQSHRRGGGVQSHKRSQVIAYVKRNGFSLKTPAAIGRQRGYTRRGYRRRGALLQTSCWN